MEFQDVVRKRKMVRSFEDRPIPRDVVDRILANARRAPSAGFSQGWAFLVLEGPEQTARYWDALWPPARRAEFGWADMFKAPLLVVCLSDKTTYLRRYQEPDKGWTDMDEKRWPSLEIGKEGQEDTLDIQPPTTDPHKGRLVVR